MEDDLRKPRRKRDSFGATNILHVTSMAHRIKSYLIEVKRSISNQVIKEVRACEHGTHNIISRLNQDDRLDHLGGTEGCAGSLK